MKGTDHNQEDDELWDLLGKVDTPQASPFFARDIVREVRLAAPSRPPYSLWHWFTRPLAGAAIACVVLAGGVFLGSGSDPIAPSSDTVAITSAIPSNTSDATELDFEIIANLDDLLAYEENALWLEELPN